MLLDIEKLFKERGFKPKGVIQVGAHIGQEVDLWKKVGVKRALLFDPLPSVQAELNVQAKKLPFAIVYPYALGSEDGQITMSVERHPQNRGMSSSCLKPKLHTEMSPDIVFDSQCTVHLWRLDTIFAEQAHHPEKYDLLSMDVQGYELEVLRGAGAILDSIECIITEYSEAELYENQVQLPELDAFLVEKGFASAAMHRAHKWWGDALYWRVSRVVENA